jgi:TonB-linked SusC/RagA family outer membrane protein
MPVLDETALGGYGGPTDSLTGINERTNPVAEQMLNKVNRTRNSFLSTVYMNVELARGLSYNIQLGANFNNSHNKLYNPKYTLGNMRLRDRDESKLEESNYYEKELQMNHQLSFSRSSGNHNFNAIAVWERFAEVETYNTAVGTDLPEDPNLVSLNLANIAMDVDGGITEHRLESYLARVQYNYSEKYYLTLSHRVDGSTRFGPAGGRYGHFPSFSLGWKLNEDLLPNVYQINMLKLRFGWGSTGNENLPDYQYMALLDPPKNSRYIFGTNQDLWLGVAPTSFQPNPLIRWESANMTNFGVDFNAFRNRLQITAEYYVKNQYDMLVSKPISVIFGKKTYDSETPKVGAWANLSQIQNRGFEFMSSWRKLEGDFNYSISANISTIKNEVIDLVVDDIITDYTKTSTMHTIGSFYGFVAERILQESDFDLDGNYLYARQETGTAPGDIKFKDLNNDGIINDLDRTIIGKPLPDMIYGLNFSASYKGFDLVVFLQGMQNLQVYNNLMSQINIASGDVTGKDQNRLVDALNYWSPENPSTTMTRLSIIDENRNSRISSWYVYEASFIRLKTLQIGYTFPKNVLSRLSIDNLRIFVSSNNLYTITHYPGYDPEIGSTDPLNMGIDQGTYPVPRSFTMGINLKF